MFKYLVLSLIIASLSSLLAADSFTSLKEWFPKQDKFRVITQDEIQSLEAITVSEMIERFGEPLRLEINALAWPKYREDMDFKQSKVYTKIRYAYWFYFSSDGYPKPTDRLKYVFSLKDPIVEHKGAIFQDIPRMTVDWPAVLQGKKVMDLEE